MSMRQATLVLAAAILASCSKEAPVPTATSGPPKIVLVSNGDGYKTGDCLVPGYVTILEFYADW